MDCGKEKDTRAGPSQDISWVKAIVSDKKLQGDSEPLFHELESIVRIKHAEAKMYQAQADDATREAESLRRIAVAKSERSEEEFNARIEKLSLAEAEEVHKLKFKELRALERSHREYFNMKIRMAADIEDLLLKMEATKRNMAL